MRRILSILLPVASLVACRGEPNSICDRERLFVALDEVEIGVADDIDPDTPGVQIDLIVNSTLDEGAEGILFVVDSEGEQTLHSQQPAIADENGQFVFLGVNLPPGRIELNVQGIDVNPCRLVQTTRELFVFDEMGAPSCVVTIAADTVDRPLIDDPVLNADADADPNTADFQTTISVGTGRQDVDIKLLIRDVGSGAEQVLEELSGEDRGAEFAVTLGQEKQAVRAICIWTEFPDLPIPSPTFAMFVDTIAPSCTLAAPTSKVVAGDDLDNDLSNGIQFALVGQVDPDAQGSPATFDVEGEIIDGSSVDEDGITNAIGTFPNPAPAQQDISLFSEDQAGNPCTDSVSL